MQDESRESGSLFTILIVLLGVSGVVHGISNASGDSRSEILPSDSIPPSPKTESVLPKMIVTAKKRDYPQKRPSTSSFDADDLRLTAGTVGDIGRYLGTLPSTVASLGPNFDNTFFVRGGDPTETMFLVDGIEFENINHFSSPTGSGGPISFVNDGFLHTVDFYAGHMPIGMPSRLSSVVDIVLRPGSFTEHTISGGIKLTGGLLSVSGPIVPGKATFILAGRYANFTPLQKILQGDGIPRMGDVLGKMHYAISEAGDFSVTGLLSINDYTYDYEIQDRDDYRHTFTNTLYERDHINQGGIGLSLTAGRDPWMLDWTAGYSSREFTERDSLAGISDTFYTARYAANPIASGVDIRRRIYSNLRCEFDPCGKLDFTGGVRINRNFYRFATLDNARYSGTYLHCSNGEPVPVQWERSPEHREMHFGTTHADLYASGTLTAGILQLDCGLTSRYYAALSTCTPSPRLRTSIDLDGLGKISTYWACNHQFPATLIPYLFDNLTHYGITGDTLGRRLGGLLQQAVPRRNRHLGLEYEIRPHERVRCGLAVYHKWYDREFEFSSPNRQTILIEGTDGNLRLGKQSGLREAYGLELSVHTNRESPLFAGGAFSLLDIKNRYKGGNWYPDWTNVGYTWSFSVGARFLNRHTISVSGTASGARPYSRVDTREDCVGRIYPVMNESQSYFSARLDPLFTLNARYGYEFSIRRLELETYLEVINVPDYRPTLEYKFNGNGFEQVRPYGLTPVLGIEAQFDP